MELEDFIERLENTEKDVDRILKAARLGRCPKEPMSKDKLEMVLNHVTLMVGILIGGGLMFSFFYFMSR